MSADLNLEGSSVAAPVTPDMVITGSQSSSSPAVIGDEISVSDQVAALQGDYNSSSPKLSTAVFVSEISSLSHDIMTNMLTAWVDSIRKIADQIEEELKSPKYQAFREIQSPAYIAKTERTTTEGINKTVAETPEYQSYVASLQQRYMVFNDIANGAENVIQGVSNDPSDASKAALALITSSIVLGADFIGSNITVPDLGTARMDITSFEKMTEQAVASVPNAADFSAQLGLIGALFLVPTIYQAEAITRGAEEKGPPVRNWAFATVYDNLLRDRVKGHAIDDWIRGMVIGHLPKANISPDKLIAMGKAILLSSALALYYRVEAGKMTGQEFLDMLDGKVKFEKADDPRHGLIALINGYLDQLSPADRTSIRGALGKYMDSNPNIEHMLKSGRLFSGVFSQIPVTATDIPVKG